MEKQHQSILDDMKGLERESQTQEQNRPLLHLNS
jgi:hypothetical protein